MKKLLPNQIRAVLQGLELRLSYREIGRRNNISRTTVGFINNIYLNSGQNLTQLQKLNDNQILELVYPIGPNKQPEPDWQQVHTRLARHGVTLLMLFEQYIKEYPGSSYSYASFCRHYAQRKIENGIRQIGGNVERIPGERMEVDFAGDKIEWVDRDGVSGSQSYLSLHYRTAACFLRKLLKMKAKTAG